MSDFYGVGLVGVPYNAIKTPYGTRPEVKYVSIENSIMNHPRKEEKSNTGAKVAAATAGLVAAGVLAYVFRGKIKAALPPKAAAFAENAWKNCKDFVNEGINTVKPYVDSTLTKGKELYNRGVAFVKPYYEKCANFFRNLVK